MSNKLAFALDLTDSEQAHRLLDTIDPYIGAVKVGLEYFIANGKLPKTKKPIILDLKLHDIPETVVRAVKAACNLGATYITMHVQQCETMSRAAEIATQHNVLLLGVSVLSSMNNRDLADIDGKSHLTDNFEVIDRVYQRVQFAHHCGLRGFVCSPLEVGFLRRFYEKEFFLVPGVRPTGSNTNDGDQKRIGTPTQAIEDGATMLVVGRPIRDAKNPAEAAKAISQEILSISLEKLHN